ADDGLDVVAGIADVLPAQIPGREHLIERRQVVPAGRGDAFSAHLRVLHPSHCVARRRTCPLGRECPAGAAGTGNGGPAAASAPPRASAGPPAPPPCRGSSRAGARKRAPPRRAGGRHAAGTPPAASRGRSIQARPSRRRPRSAVRRPPCFPEPSPGAVALATTQ